MTISSPPLCGEAARSTVRKQNTALLNGTKCKRYFSRLKNVYICLSLRYIFNFFWCFTLLFDNCLIHCGAGTAALVGSMDAVRFRECSAKREWLFDGNAKHQKASKYSVHLNRYIFHRWLKKHVSVQQHNVKKTPEIIISCLKNVDSCTKYTGIHSSLM